MIDNLSGSAHIERRMTATSEKQELEQQLRAGNAVRFIDAVSHAVSNDADRVLLTLTAFAGEPELLYAALRYASLCGVAVMLAPQGEKP